MSKAIVTFFLLLPILSIASDFSELSVKRLNGSDIQFYLTRPSTSMRVPLLLVIQGSSCRSIYKSASDAGSFSDQFKIARMDVEKYGLDKGTTGCPQSYLNNNSIDQRVADYLRVMYEIRQNSASWWNGELFIAGGSEGGVIAPIVATYIPETTKLVVMAGGTGWTMREEMLFLLEKELKTSGASEQEIKIELGKMSSTFDEAIANPTSSKVYAGKTNTYKWWNSILNLKPLNYMAALEIPILMVHGDADVSTPIQSARETVDVFSKTGKTNLTYIEYPGLDHHWMDSSGQSHADKVLGDVFSWVQTL